MLSPPFSTGMERHMKLTELRKNPNVSDNEIVRLLLQANPSERPSAIELLEGGKLPNKIETEAKYFNEVMRIVKTSDRSSPLYSRLVDTLFKQPVRRELFYTYDNDVLALATKAKKKQRKRRTSARQDDLLSDPNVPTKSRIRLHRISQAFIKVFELYGATPLQTPLLTPRLREEIHGQVFELMDSYGTVVELPRNLTLPFARWVALRDVTFMKRFVVDEVFVRPSQQRTTLGGQPLSKTQGSFDIVLPLSYLSSASEIHKLHEEVLECAQRCLNSCGITSDRIIVKIGDISQQRNAFELCGILDTRQQMQVRNILVNQDIRTNWKPLRRKLLQVISPKQSDSLRRCIQPEIDTRFDLFLHPVEDFETSFFFKIFVLDNNESHRPWLAGEGGRYDNLISEFHSHHITNNLVVAVGLRLHLTTIAGTVYV
mmetsp:Transcript_16489/g.19721  ORF Transcript_16489/g.19721 Transcript_16489/m.19721 type:complete len:429 (+) Transcript_16489:117-1403(+)